MDFDDEEQEEEIEMHQMEDEAAEENYPSAAAGGEAPATAGGEIKTGGSVRYRYRECLKNHAVGIGGHAVDGCGEFMPAGDGGTLDALKCAACGCHRNFHRKAEEGPPHHPVVGPPYSMIQHTASHHQPAGYLHVTPRQLALPAMSRDDDASNPSSSGGGGGGRGSRKRFRTKFTLEQKDRMLAFAERIDWRIHKENEEMVQEFCANTNVTRKVLKVWMHNNKNTLGKKP